MAVNSSVRMATDQNGNPIYPGFQIGKGAPTHTPSAYGQEYEDISTGDWYKSSGVSGPWNWNLIKRLNLLNFNSTTIPGIIAWYDATIESSITKDGSNNVTAWNDISGNGRNLSVTPATKPTYISNGVNGQSCINFNGTYLYGQYGTTFNSPLTFCLVGQPAGFGTGTNQTIFDSTNTAACIFGKTSGSYTAEMYSGSVVTGSFQFSNNRTDILSVCFNDASSYIKKNNETTISMSDPGTSYIQGIILGTAFNGSQACAGYKLSQVIIYNRALSESELQQVHSFYNNRYGAY